MNFVRAGMSERPKTRYMDECAQTDPFMYIASDTSIITKGGGSLPCIEHNVMLVVISIHIVSIDRLNFICI